LQKPIAPWMPAPRAILWQDASEIEWQEMRARVRDARRTYPATPSSPQIHQAMASNG